MLEIVRYGDPILRHRAKPVKRVDREIRHLVEEMLDVMLEEEGIGLAAPQVGIPLRIVVLHWEDQDYCLVNPRILHKSKETETEAEGCLSLPNLRGQVVRPFTVKVAALGIDGEPVQLEGEGTLARAICHETNHLNGVLFIDHTLPDTLHWLIQVPAEGAAGEYECFREPTTLEAALQRLLAGEWPGAENETSAPSLVHAP